MQNEKKKPLLFRLLKKIIKFFYRKNEYLGKDNMPNNPSIYVANHVQLEGPLINELYFPKKKKIWCIGQMMNLKEAPNYCYDDFWPSKTKFTRPIYKVLSYIVSPILVLVSKNADSIAVYKDARLMKTYRETIKALEEGNDIIIFPEYREEYNDIINDFLDKYIDVARLYYKKTGSLVNFVPMYHAPKIQKTIIGKPILFNIENEINEERLRINTYLKEEITNLAKSLPRHKVVPYSNIKKKNYKYSKEND